jgi:ABC-type transport system involved in multi-copper enzyme maturation permease subunit
MDPIKSFYHEIKPIIHTYSFEVKKQWKKFIVFSLITILLVILSSYITYAISPENRIPSDQLNYFRGNIGFLNFILIFAACFFFAGIICSEFSENTGAILFPKINKFKLIAGKFLGSYTFLMAIAFIYYLTLGLLGFYYYGAPIDFRYFQSFGITLLYILALGSFVTFFSSFLKSENMTIVTTIIILLIAFNSIQSVITLVIPDMEPLYSLQYVSNLISSIMQLDFPETAAERYTEFTFQNFTFRTWQTPSIEGGIFVIFAYTGICLLLALIIFKRRQL